MSTRPSMRVLATAQGVLDLLDRHGALSVADLAERLDIPRPTIYRTVDMLQEAGLAQLDAESRYTFGLRLFDLDRAARASYPVAASGRRQIDQLSRMTGQTVYLSVPTDDGVLCIDEIEGSEVGVMVLSPGGKLPLHAGAASRAVLPWRNDLEKLLASAPLASLTPFTLTSAADLLEDAERTRTRGYSVSDQDLTVGMAALGVTIHDPVSDAVVGTLSIAGLRSRILPNEARFAELLRGVATSVTPRVFSLS